jgi:glucokinase
MAPVMARASQPASGLTLALDIGGTKIAAGLLDPHGVVLHAARRPTSDTGADQLWDVVENLIVEIVAKAGSSIYAVGISSAGPMDLAAGTLSPLNIHAWQRFPIVERVAAALPGVPVRLAGDAVCVALGERWRGAARGARFLLGMVVSTGVGGGLVLDGAPYYGRTGNAGHVGHVVVEPDGEPCACGGHGCVETIAAGPRMVRWARKHGWAGADAKELAGAAGTGDPVALLAFQRAARALAAMIASVGAVCDLDLVVVGGGVAEAGGLLFDPLRDALASYAGLEFLAGLRVVPAELGGDAGLVGAAALARGVQSRLTQ